METVQLAGALVGRTDTVAFILSHRTHLGSCADGRNPRPHLLLSLDICDRARDTGWWRGASDCDLAPARLQRVGIVGIFGDATGPVCHVESERGDHSLASLGLRRLVQLGW